MTETIHIEPELRAFIDRLVESGRYASADFVVRDALRLLQDREVVRDYRRAELMAKIQEGIDDVEAGRVLTAEELSDELERYMSEAEGNRTAAE